MKDMMRMGSFLFIIAGIAGVLLAFTESLTSPLIGENRIKMLEAARREVLPDAKSFLPVEFKAENGTVTNYVAGFNEAGELTGIVLNAAPKGYAGPIEMVLGLNSNGKISGVKILSQKETPGLGTKLAAASFLEPFNKIAREKENPVFLVKQDGGDIDAITAATISSRAFCAGVREAISAFDKVKNDFARLKAPETQTATSTGGVK